jgi:predicted nuclease of predicted toxin-antitoxin system
MRILFDHSVPKGLAKLLSGHDVSAAWTMGWAELRNGDLLDAAEAEGFDVLVTVDQGIRYQQNLSGRHISLVVLTGTSKWARVRLAVDPIAMAIERVTPGSYEEVFVSFERRPSASL